MTSRTSDGALPVEKPYKLASPGVPGHAPTTVRLGGRRRRRRRSGGDGRALRGGDPRADAGDGAGGGRARGPRAARGGLQAPLVAVRLPGPGRGGAAPAAGGAGPLRPPRGDGGDGAGRGRSWSASTPTCCRSGPATARTTPSCARWGGSQQPVLLKRGPGCTVEEWIMAAEHIMAQGNMQVILCERGIRTFETATRNTLDLSAIPLVKRLTHLPVVVDPSHGTGKCVPGQADVPGGDRRRGGRAAARGAPDAGQRPSATARSPSPSRASGPAWTPSARWRGGRRAAGARTRRSGAAA